ncbi:MAG TPA: tetratricopeptide repeat protein [Terriglobales bacterium]|jgi:tetratricopeptide (TPR) repeat protein|nr:tetratricopeptide repeat protein [Terriglobales bacterium]
MTPYTHAGRWRCSNSVFLLLFLIAALVTPGVGQSGETRRVIAHVSSENDALTRSAFEQQYRLDYDDAIHDFELVEQAHPDDPFAANHLLTAIFFRELYRNGALDTGLYSNNSFLNRKRIHPDAKNAARIQELAQLALKLADARIKANPEDADAYYARGVTHGMQSTYTALVDKSWFAALGSAKDARHDHEKVLELDSNYNDAKLVVGMHSYIVGSLPWGVRVLAHIVGESGNKTTGIKLLYAAADGGGEASVDAKTVLALFLRREQRYDEALAVQRSLAKAYPGNFLFALEEANILKDAGRGSDSIAAYQRVLENVKKNQYHDPHLEFLYYGMGDALRGQRQIEGAAEAYEAVLSMPHPDADLRSHAVLNAGEMYDLLQKRDLARQKYQDVIAENGNSELVESARKYLKNPYRAE